jgi:uncharacterized protein YciI
MLKTLFVILGLLWLTPPAHSQSATNMPPGMKRYQMVFLRKGPNTNTPSADILKMQQAHLDGLKKLNHEGVNVLFGPFLDNTELRGLAVLDVPDADAARKALAEDPLVKSGRLLVDVKPWYSETNVFGLPETPNVPEHLIFGFLMRGTNREQLPAAEAQKIQAGHLAYMGEMHKLGKLVAAGPFGGGDPEWRGVVVYRVSSVEEAEKIAAGDPAVKIGRLKVDARPWMTFKGMLKSGVGK